MADDTAGRDPIAPLQAFDEPCRGLQLFLGHVVTVKIADQADADSDFVHVHGVAVGAVHLFVPPLAGLHLARKGAAGSVVDDEMIAEPVPEPAFAVTLVKNFCVSDFGGAVMNHDVFPAPGFGKKGKDPDRFTAAGDENARPDFEIPDIANPVEGHNLLDVHSVHLAEAPQRFTPLKNVINTNGLPGRKGAGLKGAGFVGPRRTPGGNDNQT